MASALLVDRDVSDGRTLVEWLERERFPFAGAFWFYRSDVDRWRLVIETPIVNSNGPLEAYRRISEIVDRLKQKKRDAFRLDLSQVQVVKERDYLPNLFRQALAKRGTISDMRIAGESVGGVFIDDAFIYRLKQAA
ncbi:MAG: hypothetical protein BroJett029_38300 [Alphaproteobacteria bacterium]|nr:MAG: hypothetical protein BroJett029_38300 [Alphaproteobacteria bacterium]